VIKKEKNGCAPYPSSLRTEEGRSSKENQKNDPTNGALNQQGGSGAKEGLGQKQKYK